MCVGGRAGTSSGSTAATTAAAVAAAAAEAEAEKFFARLHCPRDSACGRTHEFCVDGLRFISHPIALPADLRGSISLFNVSLVLRACGGGGGEARGQCGCSSGGGGCGDPALRRGGGECALDGVRAVARTIAVALMHEERRTGCVWRTRVCGCWCVRVCV